MALGATRAAVVKIVLSQSMKMAGIGIAIGSVLAIGVSWLCASLVEGINVFDATVYAAGLMRVFRSAGSRVLPIATRGGGGSRIDAEKRVSYSKRSALRGSIRVARLAGNQHAANVTAINTAATPAMVAGSRAATP